MLGNYTVKFSIRVKGKRQSGFFKKKISPVDMTFSNCDIGSFSSVKAHSEGSALTQAIQLMDKRIKYSCETFKTNESDKGWTIFSCISNNKIVDTPDMIELEAITAEVEGAKLNYLYSDLSLQECAKQLSAIEFFNEFGYICPLSK